MTTLEARTVCDFVEAIDYINSEQRGPLWYRGHSDARWTVQAGLWRDVQGALPYTQADERNFTHRFRTRAAVRYASTPGYDDRSGWLSLMQHYGLPTRLLDWSRSPLVAAYFAVEAYFKADREPRDAVVWVLSPHELNRRYAGFDFTPAINSRACEHLVDPAFQDAQPNQHVGRGSVIAAMATELDLRMFVQQGCFTVHAPQSAPLDRMEEPHGLIWRILIPHGVVHEFARQMDHLGFRGGDLFPDLQNLATELTRSYPPGSVFATKA